MMREIILSIGDDGSVIARDGNGARSPGGRVRLDGVDGDVIRVFQHWLLERRAGWRQADIRAFGALLHRALFDGAVWRWVKVRLDDLGQDERLRLQLEFPFAAQVHLAAIPWEYLCVPGTAQGEGFFLATDERLVLSRYVRAAAQRLLLPEPEARLLLIVSQPGDQQDVVAAPVVEAVRELAGRLPIAVTELGVQDRGGATPDAVLAALEQSQPHLVHFVGHGEYDERDATGRIALVGLDGNAKWIAAEDISQLFRRARAAPRVVLLHSCEGGAVDSQISFAGSAPQLARDGVPCVVAMQFTVTPQSATAFAQAFYDALAHGLAVDAAAQRGRWEIASALSVDQDPRLLGIPVVYMQSAESVLLPAG
jgi:CHAT domain-containing protein